MKTQNCFTTNPT